MRASRIVSSIVRASVSASARSAVRSVPCRLASASSPFRHMATRAAAAAASASTTSTSIPDSVRNATKYVSLKSKNGPQRRLVLLGFGAIGQGVLPLLFRHIEMDPSQCIVISNEFSAKQKKQAKAFDVELIKEKLTKTDYLPALQKHLRKGDFLINVSVDVSSIALMEYCAKNDILYMDTCNEPWAGGYSDPTQSGAARSNYAFREQALQLKKKVSATGPTALITHGANPGLVSHFVKAALLNIAKDTKHTLKHTPQTQAEWTQLAQDLGIKSIHISERDTQASKKVLKTEHEFVNTWSIDGFVEEGKQPAELGWGTHEKEFPVDGRKHDSGCDAAIYLDRPGAITRVRTWAPETGSFHGLLITHTEAISIADHFTKKDAHGKVVYRPTVHFAYHASNDAMQSMHEVAGKEWVKHSTERVMMDEIHSGRDELGVLLMGHAKGAYWYGSNLDVNYARQLVDYNNATSLQVCTGVLTGVVWAIENPHRGIVEPEEIPHQRILEIGAPYLGKLHGEYSDWKPTNNRGILFPEDVDNKDPWQFKNFRVL